MANRRPPGRGPVGRSLANFKRLVDASTDRHMPHFDHFGLPLDAQHVNMLPFHTDDFGNLDDYVNNDDLEIGRTYDIYNIDKQKVASGVYTSKLDLTATFKHVEPTYEGMLKGIPSGQITILLTKYKFKPSLEKAFLDKAMGGRRNRKTRKTRKTRRNHRRNHRR